ncbi:PQQ-binding-like beta-propeller repeat protein [Ignavibacterium sp.]|uniref:outer membrane protein assembly factor BamB family protein n=1 Tax=Ignavibacterium sp. TaxID=2651167 RepID=UPI00307DBF30
MKKILIILLVSFTSLFSQQIKFAWLTDNHIGYPTAEEDLKQSVNDINKIDDLKFIIVSGDITATGTLKELSLAKTILDKLKNPYFIIPGNHDTKWSESGCTDFIKLWGNDRFVFEIENFLFVGLHQGPRMRMADGFFAPEDLRWFDSIFISKSNSTKPMIFITHYPLDESVANWYEMTDRLKNLNTKIVLCGHGHKNKFYSFEGIAGVMGRSNLRANDKSGGYNLVEIKNDSIFFFEKNNSTADYNFWYSISLNNNNLAAVNVKRPDYSVNDSFPNVKIKWQFNSGYTIGSSATVNEKSVFLGDASGKFYSVNVSDGSINWSYTTRGAIYSTAAVEKNYVVFGSADSLIYCLNATNGDLIWQFKTEAALLSSPVIKNNIVYFGGSDRKFRAIDLLSGKLVWEFDKINGFVESKPTLYKNKIIFGAWDEHLYCLDSHSGNLIWKWKGDRDGVFYSPAVCTPVVSDETVFIVAPDRKMTAIEIETGKELWRTDKYHVRETIGISNGRETIFIRTMNDTILSLPCASELREPNWITDCKFGYDISSAQIVEKDGTIFYPTKNGLVIALNSADGKILWKFRVSSGFVNTVTPIDKNNLVITAFDGKITFLSAYDK